MKCDRLEVGGSRLPILPLARAIALSVLLFGLAIPVYGQEGRASINGTVIDQTGAIVAGAKILASSADTGQSRETTSIDNGTYSIPLLPVGHYTVTASHSGFKTETHPDVLLTVDQKATVDFSLTIGEVTQSVEVSATTQQINTTSGELGQTIGETDIKELPLNGRNPAALVFLAPGAVDGMKAGVFTRQDFTTFPTETGASVNGGRQGSTYYMLDGSNSMDNYTALASPFPNSDATQEFQVLTNNFDAQYGNSAGAVVSIITKSGTNSWHGNVFDFVRNDALNARNFFAYGPNSRDSLKRNQFGGSLGGKIIRDKLFIFGNYQGTIEHRVVNGGSARVPNSKMLQGDFSDLLTHNTSNACGSNGPPNLNFDTGQLFDYRTAANFVCPAGSGNAGNTVIVEQAYTNNFINPANFSPVALKFESQTLPTTSDPTGLVAIPGRIALQNYKEFTIKPDWYVSSKSHISGRVFWDKYSHPLESGGGNILIADRSWNSKYENYGGSWLYTIHPNLLNNFNFAFNRSDNNSVPGLRTKDGKPVSYSLFGVKITDYPTTPPGIDLLATNGFWVGQNTNIINSHNISLGDTVTWTRGKHMFVAGVNVLDQTWDESTDWLALPLFQFNGQFTGSDFSDFLLGNASSFTQGAGEFNHVHGINWNGFAQDTIRLKPNLTVMVGARWEPWIPFTPSKGRIALWRPGVQSTRYPNAPVGLDYPGDPGVPSGSGVPNEMGVISPRLSVAWQPKGLTNTSIRAAFGIFASPYEMSFYNHAADSAPFSPTFGFGSGSPGVPKALGGTPVPFGDPYSVFSPTSFTSPFPPFASSNFVPPSSTAFVTPVQIQTSFDPNFKIGKEQSWNVSIEHQFRGDILLRAAYIGSEAYHLPLPLERNPGIYSTDVNLSGNRLFSNFASVLDYASISTASYNGLQFTFDKRFSHGLQLTSNYSWGKTLDTSSSASAAFNGSVPDPFNIRFNRGKSDLNFTHIWTTYGVYELPKLKKYGGAVSGAFGGWELTGIWHLQSGLPFSIAGGGDRSQTHIGGERADVTGQPFNVKQGSKNNWLLNYFNRAAFKQNGPGTFGNSARNLLAGPHLNNLDLGIDKNFSFREHYKLQFRWEMFNATNTAAFSTPDTNVRDGASFGRITSTWGGAGAEADQFGYPSRVMQVALKLDF